MGCDIHAYVEVRRKHLTHWQPLDDWSKVEDDGYIPPGFRIIEGRRNDLLFTALAGIGVFFFSGLPAPLQVNRGIPMDSCPEIRLAYAAGSGDFHNPGFATLDELRNYCWDRWVVGIFSSCREMVEEYIPIMQELAGDGDEIRMVFWFDN